MALIFKKRVKLFKGVYLNLSKKGISSVSMGGKGLTINSSGKLTTSLPGTGLSYSTKLNGKNQSNSNSTNQSGARFIPISAEPEPVNQCETINENRADFNNIAEIVNYYLPEPIDLSKLKEHSFSKIWITIWVILSIVTMGTLLIFIVPIYLYLYIKNKLDYKKNLKMLVECNNQIEEERKTLTNTLNELERNYGFEKTKNIATKNVWIGETKDELILSLGEPAKIDEKVLKTKTKHIYFYYPINAKSYSVKVYLEDGIVAGWEK